MIGYKNKQYFRGGVHPQNRLVVFFGLVLNDEGKILIVQDNPIKKSGQIRWKESDSKYKLPGGKFFSLKEIDELSRKIRKETGISSIHMMAGRKPFYQEEKENHIVYFFVMKALSEEISIGESLKFAEFLSISEIKKKQSEGLFLETHSRALKRYFKDFS